MKDLKSELCLLNHFVVRPPDADNHFAAFC